MGFFDFLMGKNPAHEAGNTISQIPGQTRPYYQPFFEAGTRAIPKLENEYSSLLSNPGDRINKIGESFHESPGFKFALQQALNSVNRGAARGGMFGSPEHNQHSMEIATQLGNQDYYHWLDPTLNLYNSGLHGEEGFAGRGQEAGSNMASMIAQALAQKGAYEYSGQASQNQNRGSLISNIAKGAGALSAFTPWGAAGSAASTALDRFYGH